MEGAGKKSSIWGKLLFVEFEAKAKADGVWVELEERRNAIYN